MGPANRNRFAACLLISSELYDKPISEAMTNIWWDALARFDIDAVERAFHRHFGDPDHGQFMPRPADIVRQIEGSHIDAANVAWGKVMRALRSVHPDRSLAFDDALIHRVVTDLGGIGEIGRTQERQMPFLARRFASLYISYVRSAAPVECPSMLISNHDARNLNKRAEAPEPVLVGDQALAKALLEGRGAQLRLGAPFGANGRVA